MNLKKREKEIQQSKSVTEGNRKASMRTFIRIISVMQIISGSFLLILSLSQIFNPNIPMISFLVVGVLSCLSIYAGYLLYKNEKLGFQLTYVNLALQSISARIGLFFYYFVLPFGFFIYLENNGFGFRLQIDATFMAYIGQNISGSFWGIPEGSTYLAINIFSIAALYFLRKYQKSQPFTKPR